MDISEIPRIQRNYGHFDNCQIVIKDAGNNDHRTLSFSVKSSKSFARKKLVLKEINNEKNMIMVVYFKKRISEMK